MMYNHYYEQERGRRTARLLRDPRGPLFVKLRDDHGWTITEIARAAGLVTSAVCSLCNAHAPRPPRPAPLRSEPDLETRRALERIAEGHKARKAHLAAKAEREGRVTFYLRWGKRNAREILCPK